ncbi:CYTH domain-containing protein [Clostridium sardiniense]|uniref:CYTH domain-containing protein n=1 Tax=Clostridium sardiniense TaxID=29369 RepID=A0ABS7L0Y4_CLOSR|nr:CYTH domain-containing protein [Clostridium sardiniense]MBY0756706.1 CYTH domain-containing protein [Clostridium sardiniense]MDQ0458545.1 adenylate cyclase class 2 [Clostridium sardiniense]
MGKELETRVININVDDMRAKLKALDAKMVKSENQVNDIYDFDDGRLLKAKGYARIRTVNDLLNSKEVIFMTTKKMLSQGKFKEMEENEVIVDNKTMAEGIYKALGLKLRQSIKKYRESYKVLDGLVEIDINDKEFCPFPYIEIETSSVESLEKILDLIGYTMEDTTSKTIYDLIDEYNKK